MCERKFSQGLGVEPMRMMDFVGEPLTAITLRKIETSIALSRTRAREEYIAAGSPAVLPYVVTRYLVQAAGLRNLLIVNVPQHSINSMNKSGKTLALNLISDADFPIDTMV